MIKEFFTNCYMVEHETNAIALIQQTCKSYNVQFTVVPNERVDVRYFDPTGNATIVVFPPPTEYPELVYASEKYSEVAVIRGEIQCPRFRDLARDEMVHPYFKTDGYLKSWKMSPLDRLNQSKESKI
jgi:hypothetical protein